MLYNADLWVDHEFVDLDGSHWHFMTSSRSGNAICIDVMRVDGRVYGVSVYGYDGSAESVWQVVTLINEPAVLR